MKILTRRKILLSISVLAAGLIAAAFSYSFFTNRHLSRPKKTATSNSNMASFYALPVNDLMGHPFDLSQYKGKKIMLLNVASKCGFTPQYADWQRFYDENKDMIVVLGVPSNDFGAQEPGSEEEIASFCEKNYGVTFPILEKSVVKGAGKSALYQWLTDPAKNGWNTQEPSWNFCKYLINEEGELTHFFASNIKPENQEFFEALSGK